MAARTDLVYGSSGTGKSSWVLQLCEFYYTKYGLKTRVYIGDGGIETYENSGLIELGALELCQYNLRDQPFATLQFCCEGYWPEDPKDPKSKLIPPTKEMFKNYGLFVYEGLSVACDYMMGDKTGGLSNRAAKGEKIGQDSPIVLTEGTVMSDGKTSELKFGGNPPSHFGFTQRRILDLIERTRAIPVNTVIWTAHERKSEDYDTKESAFGPDVAGKALTTKIGASFGNTIHLVKASKKKKTKDPVTQKDVEILVFDFRAYTKTHHDPDGQTAVKFYANNRMPKEFGDRLPEFMDPDPVKFYSILEKAKKEKQKQIELQRVMVERTIAERKLKNGPIVEAEGTSFQES